MINKEKIGPIFRTLKYSLNDEETFIYYANCLAEDTEIAKTDEDFQKKISTIWSTFMDVSVKGTSTVQNWDSSRLLDMALVVKNFVIGFGKSLASRQAFACIDEVVGLFDHACGNIVMGAVAGGVFIYDCVINICKLYKGEITRRRCLKNIIDSAGTNISGVVGCFSMSLLFGFLGPGGAVLGGIIGGIIFSHFGNLIIDRLTRKFIRIPKDEELEKAYHYFNVVMDASNKELHKAYRRTCLKHHPDKGGANEDFVEVQKTFDTIRRARGEI